MGDDDVVRCEVADRVATVTIDRPAVRNALNTAVLTQLPRLVRECEASDEVDVIILTGADPAFSAGLDLKELGSGATRLARADAGADARADAEGGAGSGGRGPLPPTTKPIIGAVNGVAVTGGLELALACDFLIASETAPVRRHARPRRRHAGLGPDRVAARGDRCPPGRQMSLTGNYVDAPTALAWGLVNEVVPHDELLPRCRALAADIVSNDQAGVRRMRQTYAEGALVTGADAWALEADVSRAWRARGGGASDEVERRRAAVIERGRSQ